jgi:hypothetical protein
LRDLSPELSGSGSPKVQGDEATRPLDHQVNKYLPKTCAKVRGGFAFSVFGNRKYREAWKMQRFASNWKQFAFSAIHWCEHMREFATPESADGAVARNPRANHRLSQVQDRAKSRPVRKRKHLL